MDAPWLTTTVLPLVIAVVTSGLVVQLFRLGPDRRKIGAEAENQAAAATDVLTGAALRMVEQAEKSAAAASKEAGEAKSIAKAAEARATAAEQRARVAERNAADCAYEVDRHREWLDIHGWPPLPAA